MRDIAVQVPLTDEDGNSTYCLVDEESGFATERYEATQLLERSVMTRSGEKTESYAKTTIDIVYDTRAGDQSQGRSGWDSTSSVKFHTTLYFDMQTSNNETYYKLYRITGGYTRNDTSVSVVSQYLNYGGHGSKLSNRTLVNYSSKYNLQAGQTSWSIWPSSSWEFLNIDCGGGYLGGTLEYSCKRNSGTWSGFLQNNLLPSKVVLEW